MTLTRVESPVDATGGHLGFKSSESSLGRRVIILSNLLPNLSNPLRALGPGIGPGGRFGFFLLACSKIKEKMCKA